MKPIIVTLFAMIIFVSHGFAQVDTIASVPSMSEYVALIELYQSTNGAAWTNNTGWRDADPDTIQSVQGWYGVTIDGQGHVTNLQLNANNLVGTMPDGIGHLTYLKTLYLNSNQLTGAIPLSIGDLTNLTRLQVDRNNLSGAIPSSIGNLTNLTYLGLQINRFGGVIPSSVSKLTKLQNLYLENNILSGVLPEFLGSLPQLIHLTLSNNQFTGSIPIALANLPVLQKLWLNNNQLTGNVPSQFAKLITLLELNISSNLLQGNIPVIPLTRPQLFTLYINNNKFAFSNFLDVKHAFSGGGFLYNPQDSVDVKKIVQAQAGQPLTLIATVDRNTTPASIYRWFKLVNGTSTALNAASTTGDTHTIASMTQADNGVKYYYTITNPDLPGITLRSRLQTFRTVTCTQPTLNLQVQEANGAHVFNAGFAGADCTPTYEWNFGDGTTSNEATPSHAYANPGTYQVNLTLSYTCGPCPSGQLTKSYTVTITDPFCGAIYCDGQGGIGIGTRVTEGFRLSVSGKIRASDIIKVYPQNKWSDFVFENSYRLRPLGEVETFIKKNGHLPEIPSAKEVATEGIDLGAMDAKLLQKIEELTLYMIELKKQNDVLQKEVEALKSKKQK